MSQEPLYWPQGVPAILPSPWPHPGLASSGLFFNVSVVFPEAPNRTPVLSPPLGEIGKGMLSDTLRKSYFSGLQFSPLINEENTVDSVHSNPFLTLEPPFQIKQKEHLVVFKSSRNCCFV